MSTKVTQLTYLNISALRQLLLTDTEVNRVTLTATTATFDMTARDAVKLLETLLDRAAKFGQRGHPYQSLAAVMRKVERAAQS